MSLDPIVVKWMGDLSADVGELRGDVKALRAAVSDNRRCDNHGERIGNLELRLYIGLGACLVIGFVAEPYIGPIIKKIFGG